jgi:hypothetical protein
LPVLICDLRPQAAELLPEYMALREAGESLVLLAPAILPDQHGHLSSVADAAALYSAFDQEQPALLPAGDLPAWFPLDDVHRVLLISAEPALAPAERTLADAILARGGEAIEVLHPADARELPQSWFSGRRTGARLLR